MEADVGQHFAKDLDFRSLVIERRAIRKGALDNRRLPDNTFDQLPDGHTRRYGVGIDDDIGAHSVASKGHIDLGNN